MNDEFAALTLQSMLAPQTQALQQIAMRPQKSQVTTKSTPYALDDLLATRAKIGESRRALDEALKGREDLGYTLANALAGIPQQEGYGSWLGDFARAFGGGFTSPTNAKIDRMQKAYETEAKDLATILALDKAMGDVQTQEIGYTPMEYGTAGGKGAVVTGPDQVVKNIATATGEGIDPEQFIKDYDTGGLIESGASEVDPQDNPTFAARFIRSVVAPVNTGARSALAQNMSDKIIGPKIQNMVQNMGGNKGADTFREVSMRIGPLAQITSLGTQEQLGAISAAKSDVLDIINRDRLAGGLRPLTMEQFQPEWNKLFTGIATYHKTYGQKTEEEPKAQKKKAEPQEDYSQYGF